MLKTEIQSPGRAGKHSELHSDLSSPGMAAPKTSSIAHGKEELLESKALWDRVAQSESSGCCQVWAWSGDFFLASSNTVRIKQ